VGSGRHRPRDRHGGSIGSSRAVRVTPVGATALQDLLGLDPPYRPDPRDQGSGMAVCVTIPLP